MKLQATDLVCLCGSQDFKEVFTYHAPPKLEVKFQFSERDRYFRQIRQCNACGHFRSVHQMNMEALYAGDYVSSTYVDEEGLKRTFTKIVGLDPAHSDNYGRVKRIQEFSSAYFRRPVNSKPALKVLDVGSGLCVFLYAMKKEGWDCTALDPDERAVRHARDFVGVSGVQGDFLQVEKLGKFELITFNKVLEHVKDPVRMLAKAREHLREGGLVYVELPDGKAAQLEGPDREEFAIDHHHIFSLKSFSILATKAGFQVLVIEQVHEPSTKYTLRAFLRNAEEGAS